VTTTAPRRTYRPGRYPMDPCYRCGGTGCRRAWTEERGPHPLPCETCAGAGTYPRRYPTWEEAAARWPRLCRALSWAAILSGAESACCLRDYIGNREGAHRTGGGEAVAHFGGPRAVLLAGLRARRPWLRALLGGRYLAAHQTA
jgi:hypothetical protein